MRSLLATLWLLLGLAIVMAVAGGVACTVSALEPGWSHGARYATTVALVVLLLAGVQRLVPALRGRRENRDRRDGRGAR